MGSSIVGQRRRTTSGAVSLLVALALAGCSGGSGDAAAPAVTSSGSSAAGVGAPESDGPESVTSFTPESTPKIRTVTVNVAGRKVTPAPGRVEAAVGERLRLSITSDVANEVHVHGVDVEKELPAAEKVSFEITPDQEGVFEVELHEPKLLLFQLEVR